MGYDEHSFGYRDLEGAKVHKALREAYGKAYKEGDVIGCFIHMPEGGRRLEKSKAVSLFLDSHFLMRCAATEYWTPGQKRMAPCQSRRRCTLTDAAAAALQGQQSLSGHMMLWAKS